MTENLTILDRDFQSYLYSTIIRVRDSRKFRIRGRIQQQPATIAMTYLKSGSFQNIHLLPPLRGVISVKGMDTAIFEEF